MIDTRLVRGSMAATITSALILALSVSSVARAQVVLSLTSAGAGSINIPAGYEWTSVTVQCWGGGVVATPATKAPATAAAGAAGALTPARRTRCRCSPGHIATTLALAAAAASTAPTAAAAAEAQPGTLGRSKTLVLAAATAAFTATAARAAWFSPVRAIGVVPVIFLGGGKKKKKKNGGPSGPGGPGGNSGGVGSSPGGNGGSGGSFNNGGNGSFPGGGGGGGFGGGDENGGNGGNGEIIITYTAKSVPEPSTLALLAAGVGGLLGYGWKRRRRAARTPKPSPLDPYVPAPLSFSLPEIGVRPELCTLHSKVHSSGLTPT